MSHQFHTWESIPNIPWQNIKWLCKMYFIMALSVTAKIGNMHKSINRKLIYEYNHIMDNMQPEKNNETSFRCRDIWLSKNSKVNNSMQINIFYTYTPLFYIQLETQHQYLQKRHWQYLVFINNKNSQQIRNIRDSPNFDYMCLQKT